mgnify:CR=1 FL=1
MTEREAIVKEISHYEQKALMHRKQAAMEIARAEVSEEAALDLKDLLVRTARKKKKI